MERWEGKVAVVTGASAGIGFAIAELLIQKGLKVVGMARRKEKLDELALKLSDQKGQLFVVQADVTKEEEILKAFDWVKNNLGPVHVLVNSAGVARVTRLIEGETNLWKDILDTNVLGLCIATREAIRSMRENNVDGHIIHINSVGGHGVKYYRNNNVYPASKYAVTALTETLRLELNVIGSKIKISSISPGFVDTEITEASYRASKSADLQKLQKLKESFKDLPKLRGQDIAEAVAYILATPQHVQVHELMVRAVGDQF